MKNNQIRATGASCKECRRLKIKCDKMVPCGTCTKRGLQSLCPDGQLSGAKGSRYVLASTEESWHRIQALCVRVQDLEFALERAHSHVAHERHPLLEEELVKIGQDPRAIIKTEPGRSPTRPDDVPISDFGTMKISKSGSYRWLGTTALPAMMLDDYDDEEFSDQISDSFPAHGGGSGVPGHNLVHANDLKVQALQQLPSRQRALQLIDTFFESYTRWSTVIARSTVMDTLFTPAYDGDGTALSAYNISSLLSILALGCLYDQPQDPAGREFKSIRKCAKALFFSEWPKGPSTVDELESLLLLYRVSWPFTDTTPSENYELMAWGIKLGEKIGLRKVFTWSEEPNLTPTPDRDPEPLNLSAEECLRRRRVFWTLWFQDSLASLVLGQPPTLSKGFVDCKPPGELNLGGLEDVHPRTTLLMQDILTHFLESKTPPPYAAVLRIDQKIRDMVMDPHVAASIHPSVPNSPLTPTVTEQQAAVAYTRAMRSVLLLALHRTYFSYAISRPSEDPIGGRLGPSTAAIFEAATSMLDSGMTANRYTPWMQAGYTPVWMQYHTALLVLYAFPTYLPYWPQSEDAMKTADSAMTNLFYPNVREIEQIANSMPLLVKAQQKAQESFAKYHNGQWTHPAASGQPHEADLKQDFFLNDKFVIASASAYDTSRENTPSDYHASSVYPESTSSSSAYRGNWVGFDSPTVVSSETYGHYSRGHSHILSAQQTEGHFDEAAHYKNTNSMAWTPAPIAVPKMESPPHSTGLHLTHPLYPSQHAMRPTTTLQIPGEVIGVTDHRQDRAIRRVRGLSRAHSFPSDHPAGYSSAGSIQTHAFQSMQVPSPTTPVGQASMHSLEHQHVHEPYGRWIQTTTHSGGDPFRLTQPNSHGYAPPSNVPQHSQMSPTDASAIPIHVLEQSWSNFNAQQH